MLMNSTNIETSIDSFAIPMQWRPDDSIYVKFLEQVMQDPTAIAVLDEYGALSYSQLTLMTEHIASQLPPHASFVGVIMDHGAEMIAAMLAALKIGAAYVPAEPDFPPARIAFMLNECGADAVITQQEYLHLVPEDVKTIFVEPGSHSERAKHRDEMSRTDINASLATTHAKPDDLAYVLYTSGTTGTPKGVSVENRNLCSYIRAFQNEFNITPNDRMLQHSVCSFDIFAEEVFSTLLSGASLVIAPKAVKANPTDLVAFIEANDVTIVDGFPYLMDDINSEDIRPTKVRLYVSGGDVLHESQISNLMNEAQIYNTYGPSETTCCVSYFRCDNAQPCEDGTYPVGHPILGTRIDVVNSDLEPAAPDEIGEFIITGAGVSRGYLGIHPEQDNFLIDSNGIRHYLSGDMGFINENGDLVFLHRKDDQVMIEGKRVEAKEVENVLMQDPVIHQAVVVPGKDDKGFSFLVAYIVPAQEDLSLGDLKKRLSHHLTPFMIPEFFIKMQSIPLNTHGKPAIEELPIVLKEAR